MPADRQTRRAAKGKPDLIESSPHGEVLLPRRASPYLMGVSGLEDDRTLTPIGPRINSLAHVRELAQLYAHEAVMGHVTAMREADTETDRYRAREALLDRGFGKAAQSIKVEEIKNLDGATLDELDDILLDVQSKIRDMESKLIPGNKE